MNGRLLTCGERALLAEVAGLDDVLRLYAAVRGAARQQDSEFPELLDLVPAARTLLVVVRHGGDLARLRSSLTALLGADLGPTADQLDAAEDESPAVEILVHYDGADLDRVAELTGLPPADVIAAHTNTDWRVGFAGFAPGFAYLVDGDPRLRVPRRDEPRTSVPAGSVALAGEFSAIYPRSSPGGWQLIGRTDAVLFDVERQPPALLQPGSRVRFVDAERVPSR